MDQGSERVTSPSPSPRIRRGHRAPLRQCVHALKAEEYFRFRLAERSGF